MDGVSIIDAHVHLYPPEVNADPAGWAASRGEPRWAAMCTRRRRDGSPVQGFPTVDGLLRELDSAGIARAVLLGWYWENEITCAEQNRFYAACVRAHPDRLAAFASLQPTAGGASALQEVWRAHGEGLIGLGELSPHAQGFAVDTPAWGEVLDLAAELQLPVNLHVTDPASRPFPGWVGTPLEDFARLAREHPRVTFILAHWGGGLAVAELLNVYVDTAASPLLYGEAAWARLGREVPAARVLFGSDFPLELYPRAESPDGGGLKTFVAEAVRNVPQATRAALLSGNARRLFGWV